MNRYRVYYSVENIRKRGHIVANTEKEAISYLESLENRDIIVTDITEV